MTATEIQRMLARISYKPYWRFGYQELTRYVIAYLDVPDCHDHSRQADVQVPLTVPDDVTEETFPEWLLDRIYCIERHEAREYFTLDGEHIFDPHPELNEPTFEKMRMTHLLRSKIQDLQTQLAEVEETVV